MILKGAFLVDFKSTCPQSHKWKIIGYKVDCWLNNCNDYTSVRVKIDGKVCIFHYEWTMYL